MLKLYDTLRSGNAWKIRLLASMLDIPLERITLSIDRGDLSRAEFLAVAPLRQVPVLQLEDGSHLPESIAILYYLAAGTAWWPDGIAERARVLQWCAFEQERHMRPLAQLRLRRALHKDRSDASDLAHFECDACSALSIMEVQLASFATTQWIAGSERPSIADLALYPYTCMAPMGKIDLEPYPAVRAWLARVEALPGYQSLFPGQPHRNLSTAETA